MSGHGRSFFKRTRRKYPWLRFAIFISLIVVIGLAVLKWLLSQQTNFSQQIVRAPMSHHVKVPDRPLRVLTGKKLVALTFDDGPSPATTPRLLDILYDKGVVATFFELGTGMRNNPDISSRIIKDGHELGSHTMYHQNLGIMSAATISADLGEASAVFQEITGNTPKIMRPPYGSINDNLRSVVNMPMIIWSVDTLDWKTRDTTAIIEEIQASVHDGAIILMHDIYDTTIDAAAIAIDQLRSEGYEFVTVSELASLRECDLQNGVAYGSFRP